MPDPYKFRNLSYVSKNARIPGEGLQAFAAQLKELTEQDKRDLDEWADTELAAR